MARPSVAEQQAEESLMLAHGRLQEVIESVGGVAGILRQIYHRWPATKEYLDRADALLARAIDKATDAQAHVKAELKQDQAARRRKNGTNHERRD